MTTEPPIDLTCYLHEGWHPQIRPAPATRDWMDKTPEAFSYRCLPLNIANAHGWEILIPAGFSASWRGGPGVEDVVIRPDPDTPAGTAPVSLFGQGTLTIHIQGLFRTPPGWNLMVGPSPNRGKDGIFALSGVIETDWAPYTFTMNWKFTRRNHWVRFEAGEPICFFYPVQRGVLDQIEPRFAPLVGEDARQFKAWSASRDAFQAEVKSRPPTGRPSDGWQKTYFRGIDMDGRKAEGHEAKLRLRWFEGV